MMKNKYKLVNNIYYIIYLISKKYPDKEALIDKEDFSKINDCTWYVKHDSRGKREIFYAFSPKYYRKMHQLIKPHYKITDHFNHNTLDNRKANLRECTVAQNNYNSRGILGSTSKYKGVSFRKKLKKWRAFIQFKGKWYFLGEYNNEEYAAHVYDRAAIRCYGKWAYLNFPADIENTIMIDIERFFEERTFASPHMGVTWDKNKEKWQSRIYYNKKTVHLGRFNTEVKAAKAYNNYVIKNGLNKKLNMIE